MGPRSRHGLEGGNPCSNLQHPQDSIPKPPHYGLEEGHLSETFLHPPPPSKVKQVGPRGRYGQQGGNPCTNFLQPPPSTPKYPHTHPEETSAKNTPPDTPLSTKLSPYPPHNSEDNHGKDQPITHTFKEEKQVGPRSRHGLEGVNPCSNFQHPQGPIPKPPYTPPAESSENRNTQAIYYPKKRPPDPSEDPPTTSPPPSITQFPLGYLDGKSQSKTAQTSNENHGKDQSKAKLSKEEKHVGPRGSYGLEGGIQCKKITLPHRSVKEKKWALVAATASKRGTPAQISVLPLHTPPNPPTPLLRRLSQTRPL